MRDDQSTTNMKNKIEPLHFFLNGYRKDIPNILKLNVARKHIMKNIIA